MNHSELVALAKSRLGEVMLKEQEILAMRLHFSPGVSPLRCVVANFSVFCSLHEALILDIGQETESVQGIGPEGRVVVYPAKGTTAMVLKMVSCKTSNPSEPVTLHVRHVGSWPQGNETLELRQNVEYRCPPSGPLESLSCSVPEGTILEELRITGVKWRYNGKTKAIH